MTLKIVASDDQLNAVAFYDLALEVDCERFNHDIATRTDLYFLDRTDFYRQLEVRKIGTAEFKARSKRSKRSVRRVK